MLQLTLRFAVFAKKICVYYIGIHLYFQPEKLDCIYIFVNWTTYMVYGCAATKKSPAEKSSGKKPCYNSTLANDKYSYRCFSCKKTHQTLRCVVLSGSFSLEEWPNQSFEESSCRGSANRSNVTHLAISHISL